MKRRLAALLLACSAAACGAEALGKAPSLFPDLPTADVRVTTATGTHSFSAWIAADFPSRARGLMYIRELPPGHGMLFLFEAPQYASFWMKNTYLPLDIIFIAKDGKVVNIARGAPHSVALVYSASPVTSALELVAGSAERIGLATGDRVSWSFAAAGKRGGEFIE